MELEGRVALVTGAGSGIGRAAALAFAAAGADVAVVDVDADKGAETARAIEALGSETQSLTANVALEQDVAAMVEAVTSRFGRLDFAHNNAGISPRTGNLVDCSAAQWDSVIGVNLTGVWLGMKYEIPAMLASGGGAIVNTSSGVGLIGMANQPAYVASKHGVVGLTMTGMVREGIAAGKYTEAGMAAGCPMGRLASPEEIARVVVWLCTESASFVNGAIVPVDGGTVVGPVSLA
jgi:NAD(P)-dependent dehydrogenase (short-subunit alcohol dehydrogenase family)